jgi:hypothetical protein
MVQDDADQCVKCAKRSTQPKRHKAALRTYNVRSPFKRVAMDVLGPLKKTARGNVVILVVADLFTQMDRSVPVTKPRSRDRSQGLGYRVSVQGWNSEDSTDGPGKKFRVEVDGGRL